MKTLFLHTLLFLFGISISFNLHSQEIINLKLVEQVYEVLLDKSATSQDIAVLIPVINLKEVRDSVQEDESNTIKLSAIIKKEWRSIVFEKLKFQTPEKNQVLVTGILRGRMPTECEYISYQFNHYWFLKDGKIVDFSE